MSAKINAIGNSGLGLISIFSIIAILSALIFVIPFIFRKLYSRKTICVCGEIINPIDVQCPKCGRKVEK
jgi:hypothetical protein